MTMNGHEFAPDAAREADVPQGRGRTRHVNKRSRHEAQVELDWHRAETERLRVLVDFLSRPIHAHGGNDPDPDIVTAYNLAVEAALLGIRNGAREAP